MTMCFSAQSKTFYLIGSTTKPTFKYQKINLEMGLRGLKATLTSSDWPHISPPGDRTGAVCASLHSLRPSPSFHPSLKPPLNHNKFIGKWDWEGWGYLNTNLFWLATHLGDRTGALCASLCSLRPSTSLDPPLNPPLNTKKNYLEMGLRGLKTSWH